MRCLVELPVELPELLVELSIEVGEHADRRKAPPLVLGQVCGRHRAECGHEIVGHRLHGGSAAHPALHASEVVVVDVSHNARQVEAGIELHVEPRNELRMASLEPLRLASSCPWSGGGARVEGDGRGRRGGVRKLRPPPAPRQALQAVSEVHVLHGSCCRVRGRSRVAPSNRARPGPQPSRATERACARDDASSPRPGPARGHRMWQRARGAGARESCATRTPLVRPCGAVSEIRVLHGSSCRVWGRIKVAPPSFQPRASGAATFTRDGTSMRAASSASGDPSARATTPSRLTRARPAASASGA
eukprot:CAMPEP_0179992178 /NCGR_PEP_ID=MMETSP0984-20121128/5379_1 /TAXON_ID=483367 /ORGANISM="non described non described, Strain CCMP 2436" /LENGTH=303 /DNA_ID=CAMNT_0021911517 /DNA_START=313 /DNA_END=1223 /DNA_ORIENTATION=+